MAVYEGQTRVRAPLDDVWAFHSQIEGLLALTPEWVGLEVESVTGPDGAAHSEELLAGTRIVLSVRPFGVGPRRATTSEIVERRREDGAAMFRDRMVDGPLDRWVHTHSFFADGEATVVRDRVEYELPGGAVGTLAASLAKLGLDPLFRYRHRRTRTLLEGHGSPVDSE